MIQNSLSHRTVIHRKSLAIAMICGILGCLCYGGGDWLMLYGDATTDASLFWLTDGVIAIAPWRNALAMVLAFPGIILYGVALFYLQRFITNERERSIYHYLNAFGLTPWLALHLFYIMILYVYAWMNTNGYAEVATATCEALYAHLSWVVMLSEVLMLPVFLYWAYLVARGRTSLPRMLAAGNVLVFYVILKALSGHITDGAFRLGFTNGLMSESMVFFFLLIWIAGRRTAEN